MRLVIHKPELQSHDHGPHAENSLYKRSVALNVLRFVDSKNL